MKKSRAVIGRVEKISFPELGFTNIPARIDTGAKTSAIWVSGPKIDKDGQLSFYLFGKSHRQFKKKRLTVKHFTEVMVASSMGQTQKRYKVKLLVLIKGRKIRASFNLSDRSKQVYPALVGRNVLRGKFVVDIKKGSPNLELERARSVELQSLLKRDKGEDK